MTALSLAIEISNPSSGPRGRLALAGRDILAGPGVAIAGPGFIDAELLNDSGRHDDDLMPAIDRLVRRAGGRPRDLTSIILSTGPGGFTSLRIAVATAKLLALGAGARISTVPSALVAAALVAPDAPTLICLASKAQTAHATLLPAGPDRFARAQDRGLITAADLLTLGIKTLVADRFLPEPFRAAGIPVIEPVFAAATLFDLPATETDPDTLAPVYPRPPEAVTLWQARRAGGR